MDQFASLSSSTLSWMGTPGRQVCVAIAAASAVEMVERAGAALVENSFLELRLDSLPEPEAFLQEIRTLLRRHPAAKVIATCRRTVAGGGFAGSTEQELAVLEGAAAAGCVLVDLAVETADELASQEPRELERWRTALHRAGTNLIVSSHDFLGTGDLETSFARITRHQPDVVKLVSTATCLADNLAMLRLLGEQHAVPVIGIAMGEAGIVSRVLGPRAGGLFTFAAPDQGAGTAPGQVTAATLRDLYRIDRIGPATRIYGVAGKPVSHSLSPLLQNTGFHAVASSGLSDAVFLPLVTDSVADLMRLVRELPLAGLSITMPLKQAMVPYFDEVDDLARRVGACNTMVRTAEGRLRGANTDVDGVTVPLARRLALKGARVLVAGAGGAARAAVFGLRDKGAEVWILNRTRERAAELAEESGAQIATPAMLREESFDVLVNATPAGMHGVDDASRRGASAAAPGEPLCARLIFDMVYHPLETPLIRRARAQGLAVITGEEMFVQQGVRQFELWTGLKAPEAEMSRAVLAALRAREATEGRA